MNQREELLQAIAVTAELTGTKLSEGAARVVSDQLSRFPHQQVLGALSRCQLELKGRLTLADVITRLNDGRPGPEEAWAMMPKDEAASVVWTAEMAACSAVSRPLLEEGDPVAARMAFLECYRSSVQAARNAGVEVCWTPSLGYDVGGRESALVEAARLNRLPHSQVQALLPHRDIPAPEIIALLPR